MISVAIAFTFGFLHTLEPGHGKTALLTYLADEKKTVKDATLLSIGSAVSHTLSIFIFAVIAHGLAYHNGQFERMLNHLGLVNIASGLMISLLGVWTIFKGNKIKASSCCSCHHDHDHDHDHDHHKKTAPKKYRRYFSLSMVGIAIGMIPCPSLIVAYLSSASSHHTYSGITNILFFTLGMTASLMMILVLFKTYSKRMMTKLKDTTRLKHWPTVQGGAFILIGLFLALYH
jgi:nickel/cobalt transporter (NicO) family protein